jgi:hypothetical protein
MVLNNFIFSPEFRDYMIGIFGDSGVRPEYSLLNDLYRGILSRLPDDGGYIFWLAQMQAAQCAGEAAVRDLTSQIALIFITSTEYRDKGRSNSEFLEDLYDAILRRAPDLGGHLFWLGQLNSGALSREEVLQEFVKSDEFQDRVQEVIDAGCYTGCGNDPEGLCGNNVQAPDGCYCDENCFAFGDCCPDVCAPGTCISLSGCNPGGCNSNPAVLCGTGVQAPDGCYCDEACFSAGDCCPDVCNADACSGLAGCS